MTVPLYIFEERYKRLVKYCLKHEQQQFVIALAKDKNVILDGDPKLHSVGTFIHILQTSENPDGTINLFGHGQGRCKLDIVAEEAVSEGDGSVRPLYFTSSSDLPLDRGDPNLERVAAWDALDTFRKYAKTFFAFDALKQIDQVIPEDLVYQASFICANVRTPVNTRQVLLEAPSLTQRFQLVQKLMQERIMAHNPKKASS